MRQTDTSERPIRRRRSISPAVVALLLLLLPVTAWGSESLPPLWLRMMPRSEGRVYGVGVAAIATTPAAALEIAGHAARFEILAQLRSSVRGQAVFQTEMVSRQHTGGMGSAARFQHSALSGEVSVAEKTLPGITIEETYLDQEERTAYVLAFLDVAVARRGCEVAYTRLAHASQESAGRTASPVASLVSLLRVKKEAAALSEVVTLLRPFISCEELSGRIAVLQEDLTASVELARTRVTCGLDPREPLPAPIREVIRMQVEQAGCAWNDASPGILIAARIETAEQRVGFYPRDFHVRRMAARVTLRGADRKRHDSFSFEAKGIGMDSFTAEQSLQKNFAENFREKLLASRVGLFGELSAEEMEPVRGED